MEMVTWAPLGTSAGSAMRLVPQVVASCGPANPNLYPDSEPKGTAFQVWVPQLAKVTLAVKAAPGTKGAPGRVSATNVETGEPAGQAALAALLTVPP